MVLLHDIIEILTVADNDGRYVSLIIVRNRCPVRATLIDRDFLRQPLGANRLLTEGFGRILARFLPLRAARRRNRAAR